MEKIVKLWAHEQVTLDCYMPQKQTCRAAVVILPGGGYEFRAEHEGKGYAAFLNSHGIAAFVCQYRIAPQHCFPAPLLDARRAIQYVRHHADTFGIDPEKVYIMGSSAGGHLAALTSTYTAPLPGEDMDEVGQEDFLPNGQILCYPVIHLTGEFAHEGSAKNLMGDAYPHLAPALSPHLIAGKHTPKAFIWHTFQDGLVSAVNSLDYARRLRQLEIPVEMHIYPMGHHGLGLAEDTPRTCEWSEAMIRWICENE